MSSKGLSVFDLLDKLELMVETAKTIPIYGRIMLDREECASLVRRVRDSIPADLQAAKELLSMEEKIISESRKQAEATLKEANMTARQTVDSANNQANATLGDAQTRANSTLQSAADQANAMVADAQARSSAMIADAQARAQQMVADSEIVARAQAQAQDMLDSAHRECDAYTAHVREGINALMEHADAGLARQLDELRALRQDLSSAQQ